MRPTQHPPQLHQQQKKTQIGECRDRGFEGGYSTRGCQPTEPPDCGYGPPKATVSCARPLSPATGPSQDFRPAATACKERHQMDTIQKNNQERALHTSDTSMEGVHWPLILGNHIRAAVKKKLKMEVNGSKTGDLLLLSANYPMC